MKRLLLFIFALSTSAIVSAQRTISLNNGWQFRKDGTATWYKAQVPGTVHTDLLANKLIPDPFYRDNESKVQWIEEESWEYTTTFDVPTELLQQKHLELQFDGLDTYAEVYLNGKKIIAADNMFRQWVADIRSLVKPKANKLLVVFPPVATMARLAKQADSITRPDNERVYIRKAQYQFGWDWGPRLVTCGIWKDVRIITSPTAEKQPAVNNVRLVTQKDSIGEAFYFTVDGKPTFIKGANWIPADNFLPGAKRLKRYEQLIKAAKEANINMLRVWGGGVYEDDAFYDLCDQYGIMVWQDFMFAGALYPADAAFLKNIEEEVRYQVKRLRHHPSIVLWCGNNEIEEAWFNWGWQKQFNYSPGDSLKLWNDYKKIFHELIPGILQELDPQRPYWPSSPSLGWGRDSAYKKGDVHYWGVWWGKEPVEKYNEKVGRFVSEYGMQGMPVMKTIKQFSLPQDWDTSSAVMQTHQKHPFGWENIRYYINQKFRTPKSFEDLVYVSQLMQADAIKTAIEAHRRNKPTTMGTMFWQWNDCWPVTSWSAVDYYGRKKAMYYQVKRSFAPVSVIPQKDSSNYKLYVVTDDTAFSQLSVEYDSYWIEYLNDKEYWVRKRNPSITINPDPLRPEAINLLPHLGVYLHKPDTTFPNLLYVRVKNDKGIVIDSTVLFLHLPKDWKFADPRISISIKQNTLELIAQEFAYGVYVDVPDGVELEDNYFHLVPGEKKIINFTSPIPIDQLKKQIRIKSLVDTY